MRKQIEEVVQPLLDQFKKLIIAYEPVWAIGTSKDRFGRTGWGDPPLSARCCLRNSAMLRAETVILYGGSCKPGNAAELFAKADVDGGLIGGAALKAEDFIAIGKGFSK